MWYTGVMIRSWKEWKIKRICESDEEWPRRLKAVKPKVKKLYYRGKWDSGIFKKCLAVVGSRKMTQYGEGAVEKILPLVVQNGVTIVSGFMYGVDTKAHKVCLDYGGKTIAVLGTGLDQLTPKSNDRLYTEVLNNGGIVMSEYEADEKSQRWMFPQRNRIVAGLAQATLVIEGGAKSGTLITAKITRKQKKLVLAVPGPVESSQSRATNSLIQDGAVLVTSGEDVLRALGMSKGFDKGSHEGSEPLCGSPSCYSPLFGKTLNMGRVEKQIIEELMREALDMDELSRKLEVSVVELGQKLSKLQLGGMVKERLGKYTVT